MSDKIKFVNFLIEENKKLIAKDIFKELKSSIEGLKISKPQVGKIGDNLLISFKTYEKFYEKIEIFLLKKGIKILNSKQTKDLSQNNPLLKQAEESWLELKERAVKSKKILPIQEYINKGDYKSLISISKNIHLKKDLRNKAKEAILSTVTILIGRLFEQGKASSKLAYKSIEELLKIASNQEIRSLNEENLQRDAVVKAVELAKEFEENYYTLVLIANNNKIPALGNIKAGIELAEICLSDKEKYDELINYAVEKLNTRWVQISMDAKTSSTSLEEIKKVETFISLVKNRRK